MKGENSISTKSASINFIHVARFGRPQKYTVQRYE